MEGDQAGVRGGDGDHDAEERAGAGGALAQLL